MSAPAAGQDGRRPRAAGRVLLAVVASCAAFTVGVMSWASGYGQGRPLTAEALLAVVFAGWALVPFAAMAAVVVLAARAVRAAMVAVALGVLVLGVLTVALLVGFLGSESSTAALLFVFLPVYQLLVVAATAGAAAVVHLLARRARARRGPAGGPRRAEAP